ncbi:MAG: TonB family protein [Flavobacteriales bacterium]|nr:TonB family protein [Flavobacteriales bacterium]
MEALTYYMKANLVFLALHGAYLIALRHETWFHARRTWLLASAALALILPLVPIGTGGEEVLTITLPAVTASGTSTAMFSWWPLIVAVHVGVSVVRLFRLAQEFRTTLRTVRQASAQAGSFLGHVQLPAHATGDDRAALLAHELVHARQGHSVDVLLFRVLSALFWSNPAWSFALRELRLVHEHLADAAARRTHPDYGSLLVAQAFGTSTATLLNSFGSSNLKQRLNMLYNERSPRLTRRRLLIALPAMAIALVMVSWQASPYHGKDLSHLASVFPGVDQQPEYPGGMEALARYMSGAVRYPEAAVKEKVEGIVYVSFTVKSTGKVDAVSVKRGVRQDLDDEAIRVVRGMPDWKPGTAKGKPVDAQMTLPVAFRL